MWIKFFKAIFFYNFLHIIHSQAHALKCLKNSLKLLFFMDQIHIQAIKYAYRSVFHFNTHSLHTKSILVSILPM